MFSTNNAALHSGNIAVLAVNYLYHIPLMC